MSRFKPRVDAAVLSPLRFGTTVNESAPSAAIRSEQTTLITPRSDADAGEERPSLLQRLGLFILFAYVLSGVLNDFAMRVFGTKAYISVFTLVLLPPFLIISGDLFRGLRHRVGWLWLGFFVWMLVATPFSFYRRGSVTMLLDYGPRAYLDYFYITAFALSLRSITRLMYVQIGTIFMLLLSCWYFGGVSEDGRFRLAQSSFWANSNDVALALLLGAVQFVYLFYSPLIFTRIVGWVGSLSCLFYMSRTGSRGAMVAFLAALVGMAFMTKRKALYLALALPCALAFFLFASTTSLNRLLTLSTTISANSDADPGAIGSEIERKRLFIHSLQITLQHPLFGVGPNEFAGYEFKKIVDEGGWAPWVGTHNSYTQVSSESGIVAFICYSGVVFICLGLAYRMYERTRQEPSLREINRISFVLTASLMVYAIATFFFHMAYTGLLPTLAGTTIALYLASKQTFASRGIELYAK